MKKIIAGILAICSAFSLVACGGGGGNGDGDNGGTVGVYNRPGADKTQINFINFHGGVGSNWLVEAAEEFAKNNQETSFGNNHKGVYINPIKTMSVNTDNMNSASYHIYTAERFTTPKQLATEGKLMCLDDIILDDTREGGSLDSIIYENCKGSLQGNDGKYYGLPYYETYGGLSYNYKIFDEIGAFFSTEDDGESYDCKYSNETYYFTNGSGVKAPGPDGIPGTEDDGLATSMEELIVLMSKIKDTNQYAPVVLSGQYTNYANYFLAGMWAALAGYQQMNNYYNCTGEIEIVKLDSTGKVLDTGEDLFPGIDYIKKPQTETVTLNDSNGYLGQQMVAKYYAYAMLEIMQTEGFFSSDVDSTTKNHYDAQMALYIGSKSNYKDAAMLIEASYWYNESEENGCFNKLALWGESEKDLDVRVMSLPCNYYTEGATSQPTSFIDISQAYLFVSKNVEKDEEIKKAVTAFIQYLYSTEGLQNFTKTTGVARSIRYELTDAQYESMPNFYQRLWKSRKTDGSNVIYCAGTSNAFKSNNKRLQIHLSGLPLQAGASSDGYKSVERLKTVGQFEGSLIGTTAWVK